MCSVNLSILRHQFLEFFVQSYYFELLIGAEASIRDTLLDELVLEGNYALQMWLRKPQLRRTAKFALFFWFFVLQRVAQVFAKGVCIEDFTDAEQVTPLHVLLYAYFFEKWLEKSLRLPKLAYLGILLEKNAHISASVL